MDVIAAAEAKTNFGALLDKAQREPVKISKNSRDVAVVMSMEAFNEYQEAKLQLLRRYIREGLDDLERGAVVDGDKAFRDLEREFG
jgi:prevent-host-death family protein